MLICVNIINIHELLHKKGTSHRSVSELLSNAEKKINVECSAEMHAMPVATLQNDGVSGKVSTHV